MRTSSPIAVCLLALLCGCSLPQWRVFQKTVPTDSGPTPAVVEAQRQGAKFIERKSATPESNPTKQLAAIHAVAQPLSRSLGEPAKPITDEDTRRTIEGLEKATIEAQAKADKWREFSRKYAGTALEDTGVNLAGPAGLLGLIGVLIAYLMKKDKAFIRSAWIGWGVWVAILIAILASSGGTA
jgi:ABC-type phosphate/phosphonate transport system substrate-binding protein